MFLSESIQNKWQPVLDHPDLPKIGDSYKRAVTSVVLENQEKSLKEEVNKTLETNVELNQKIGEFARDEIINDVSSDLAETETEKLKDLAESIEYVDAADYRTKVETIKNSYFPKSKASDTESNEVAATENMTSDVDLSESMAAYTAAISKNQAKKLY